MDEQVSYFAKTRQDMVTTIGAPTAQALLGKALYFLSVGGNDIVFGEFSFDANKYVDEVVSNFKSQLTRLYHLDARKIVVSGVSKVGCFPFEVDTHLWVHDCVASLNKMAQLYNSKLKSLLEDLTKSLTGSMFVYVDNYAIMEDIMNNYASYGFENVDQACCEVIGRHGGLISWTSVSGVCPDRTKHVFWDAFHPTESAVSIAAKHALDGGFEYVSPINIRKLVSS
ncbi:hypothetical protein V6N13_078808 [Hibiscus sabdariffa]|uniref:GDSL esterase/lipase n=1 Tax=Hibiscus sabdariffa TaxID=183260 RepID=A0ABR2RQ09_9ROSI